MAAGPRMELSMMRKPVSGGWVLMADAAVANADRVVVPDTRCGDVAVNRSRRSERVLRLDGAVVGMKHVATLDPLLRPRSLRAATLDCAGVAVALQEVRELAEQIGVGLGWIIVQSPGAPPTPKNEPAGTRDELTRPSARSKTTSRASP